MALPMATETDQFAGFFSWVSSAGVPVVTMSSAIIGASASVVGRGVSRSVLPETAILGFSMCPSLKSAALQQTSATHATNTIRVNLVCILLNQRRSPAYACCGTCIDGARVDLALGVLRMLGNLPCED